ncbi:MAG: 1-(5-phosphoribosyl)-5-[(5-phosphoribosylamino)methylideneamino]imidazole-4-carboxamide isomerase [Thermoguttaceae bacterium]|nr:1-(5-phosphoribosyl)-5-[(5-phosphoribosylamino)methylideneamino]imidazole-4-carboxamide isomerase [Thermoguttaceae bacterium]MDW8078966.1 1-(5-phosphoribosyl)-5-[(5-phosphoribosylamino)methylideneamino]imidazole-4-carboxamide isomerase [Thermoguttaceae bacterium]
MEIWPAIDLLGGKCVRLRQGKYDDVTVFGEDPVAMAQRWVGEGASRLHIVDLDGAKAGKPVNLEAIAAIRSAVTVTTQVGGGLRSEEALEQLFALGVDRAIVGTAALRKPEWFRQMCRRYPNRLVLAVDARDGWVAVEGWQEVSRLQATEVARMFAGEPLAAILYTDIASDGMMTGPNIVGVLALQQVVTVPVIASGGIGSIRDVEALAQAGVKACIIGRALYEGAIRLGEALEVAERFAAGR